MTWDHNGETDDRRPVISMATPVMRMRLRSSRQRFSESITRGTSRLESDLTWEIRLNHEATLTDQEAKDEVEILLDSAKRTKEAVFTRCLIMLDSLPEPIMPTVLDQFQEIAEYETRMWHFRAAHGDQPSIGESLRVLPAGRE